MKARLRYYSKSKVQNRYVVELSIHEVGKSAKYPDGIKYGLICKDLKTGKYVLLDNHHPKGPHAHISDRELAYEYVDDDKLIEDFQMFVLQELGVKL
ncbi:MAG: hypothetical protein NDI61_04515 [Bdellovibrionaceae bacterium]|nr:hypothetical protein [Pseudobdellovibrionaceae bacterium]